MVCRKEGTVKDVAKKESYTRFGATNAKMFIPGRLAITPIHVVHNTKKPLKEMRTRSSTYTATPNMLTLPTPPNIS